MVFAAGLGTRMRPITETIPKPLVKVAGRALIDHMLDRLDEAGVARAVVNVHYLGEQIIAHLAGRRTPDIVISDERGKLLDQGGGIVRALPQLGSGPFLVCNTDALWIPGGDWSLTRLFERWDPGRMDVLLLVAATSSAIGVDWPGDFMMDAEGRLAKRGEREVAPFVYAGVGVIKPELFAGETREVFRLAPTFFAAAERGRLFGARLDGTWLHVGAPEAIAEADAAFVRSVL
ncbi:MAG: nucleotidyltransferase family protein [Methylobacteriaceae bacterium]|nr:nucleotidyltransferase family protein [Methylobacteriaceae bacterium]